jgi:cellulose synthase/poly-beta-1,6-N-acetylglucosamine synthase-like glycosyltransferase
MVFCAYNESRAMGEKISNIEALKSKWPDIQVIAFDDGSSDSTYDQLAARPDIITVIKGEGRKGKAYGMKLLASQASGDVIVFTDANVTLRLDAIENLTRYFSDLTVGGVCGSLHHIDEDGSATANVGGLYWKLEEYLKELESKTGNVMGADGSIFALRRELYPTFPDTVLDDLTVSMASVFNGRRLIKAEDVVAYERLVSKRSEEFSRKVRIAARAFHTHRHLVPQLRKMQFIDKFKYVSRKYIRWFGGLFLIIGFVIGLAWAFVVDPLFGLIVTGCAVLGCLLGVRARRGVVASIAEIVIALLATLLGILAAMRGQTFAVWNPAKSR